MSSLSLFTHVPLMLQGALRIMRQLRSERLELDHVRLLERKASRNGTTDPSDWMSAVYAAEA
jgi:hypothetical protein